MDDKQLSDLSFEDVMAENARLQDKVDRLQVALQKIIAISEQKVWYVPEYIVITARAALKDDE